MRALLLPKRLPAAAARSPRRASDPTRTQPIGPCARCSNGRARGGRSSPSRATPRPSGPLHIVETARAAPRVPASRPSHRCLAWPSPYTTRAPSRSRSVDHPRGPAPPARLHHKLEYQFYKLLWMQRVLLLMLFPFASASLSKLHKLPACDSMKHVATWGANAVAITSFNTTFMHGTRRKNTFADPAMPNPTLPFVIYYEHTPSVAIESLSLASCAIDLFAAQPWLANFTRDTLTLTKTMKTSLNLNLQAESPAFLVRKVAAMHDAVSNLQYSKIVIWMDVDAVFNQPVDDAFLSFMSQHDVATIARFQTASHLSKQVPWLSLPETGVVALQVTENTRLFLWRGLQLYRGGMLELIDHNCRPKTVWPKGCHHLGFNDIRIWKLLVSGVCSDYADDLGQLQGLSNWHVHDLKVGWFSVGCIGMEDRSLPWLSLATRYPKAYSKIDYICPQANTPRPRGCSSASPFNVLKYFTHLKGGNGMMTARANECARMGVPHADCNLQGF